MSAVCQREWKAGVAVAQVQAGMLCNAASLEATGLVSMLGAFVDTVMGPVLPVRQQLTVVVRVLWGSSELNQVTHFDLSVTSPLGVVVARIEGAGLTEGDPSTFDPAMPAGSLIVLPLPVEFGEVGIHRVRLAIEGSVLWEAPLK